MSEKVLFSIRMSMRHWERASQTRLKAATRWQQVGSSPYGNIFATKDQIVTVEASNIYEAQLVVSNQFITGFYLIVEKKFAPVTRPIHIEIQPITSNQNTP